MKITILGSGTSQGIPVPGCGCHVCTSPDSKDERLRVSAYIETNQGNKILIDTSPDLRAQLLRHKIVEVDAILYTHEHNDHVAGLDDIRPINFLQRKSIPMYASESVVKQIKIKYDYVFRESPYPGAPRIDEKIIEGPIDLNEEVILPIDLMHGDLEILGYRIGDFAYLTDVKTIPDHSFPKLKGLEVLVINALHEKEHHSHLNLKQALEMIEKINPTRAYLTHISHRFARHEEILLKLPDHVKVAYDGMIIDL